MKKNTYSHIRGSTWPEGAPHLSRGWGLPEHRCVSAHKSHYLRRSKQGREQRGQKLNKTMNILLKLTVKKSSSMVLATNGNGPTLFLPARRAPAGQRGEGMPSPRRPLPKHRNNGFLAAGAAASPPTPAQPCRLQYILK